MIIHANIHHAMKVIYQKSEKNRIYNSRYLCDLFDADLYKTFGQYHQIKEWSYSPECIFYKDFIENVEKTEWCIGLFHNLNCIITISEEISKKKIYFTEEFNTIRDWTEQSIIDPSTYAPKLINILEEDIQLFLPLDKTFMEDIMLATKTIKGLLQ